MMQNVTSFAGNEWRSAKIEFYVDPFNQCKYYVTLNEGLSSDALNKIVYNLLRTLAKAFNDFTGLAYEVVASILESLITSITEMLGSLYRDDALFIIPYKEKSLSKRIRKKIPPFFEDSNLGITFDYGT